MLSLTHQTILALVGINVLTVISLWLPVYGGVWSLGLAGFMTTGALLSGYFTMSLGLPLLLGALLAVVATAAAGAIAGLMALRIKALYLAIGTLAFGELLLLALRHVEAVGGLQGMFGYPRISVWGIWLIVAFVLAACLILFHSRAGRACEAAAQDPVAAAANGINISLVRLAVTAGGAGLSAVAGIAYASFYSFASPTSFDFRTVIVALIFLVVGGLTPGGAMLGAILLTLIPQYLRFLTDWQDSAYAAIVIAMLALRPQGLLPKRAIRSAAARATVGNAVFGRTGRA